jgi:hypothetical protein
VVVVGGGGVESEFSDQLWLWPIRTKDKIVTQTQVLIH